MDSVSASQEGGSTWADNTLPFRPKPGWPMPQPKILRIAIGVIISSGKYESTRELRLGRSETRVVIAAALQDMAGESRDCADAKHAEAGDPLQRSKQLPEGRVESHQFVFGDEDTIPR